MAAPTAIRRQTQLCTAHWGASERQDSVHSNRAKKRALTRHVRTAHDQKSHSLVQQKIVPDADSFTYERVSHSFRLKHGCPFYDLGKMVPGMFVGIGGERKQRLKFPQSRCPFQHFVALLAPPALDRHAKLRSPHQTKRGVRKPLQLACFGQPDKVLQTTDFAGSGSVAFL